MRSLHELASPHRSQANGFCLASFCLVAAIVGARELAAQDPFTAERAAYNLGIQRPSLYKRTKARERFAETLDPRALEILIKAYQKPEKPADEVRGLIVSICAHEFDLESNHQAYSRWRKRHSQDSDAWMWYRTLNVLGKNDDFAGLRNHIRDTHRPVLRSAALEAYATSCSPYPLDTKLVTLARGLLDKLPTNAIDRALQLEAVIAALRPFEDHWDEESFGQTIEKLLTEMARPTTFPRTRLVLSRYLATMLDTPNRGPNAEAWRAAIALGRGSEAARGAEFLLAAEHASFFGIREHGNRIAYLIDASDSMLTPLNESERSALTGRASRLLRPDQRDAKAVDKLLDWSKIKTRFDAAREFLKLSLKSLAPKKKFVVILFGTKAKLLASTKGLTEAQPKNLEKVFAELDAIRAGKPRQDRPHGTLFGYTNIHGAFRLAYGLRGYGNAKKNVYVDLKAWRNGCDTIFLLSDGKPSWDDFAKLDRANANDRAGDPESGAQLRKQAKLLFFGPFGRVRYLLEDVRRLNLIRRASIHAVGLGEADVLLLEELCKIGLGTVVEVGAK